MSRLSAAVGFALVVSACTAAGGEAVPLPQDSSPPPAVTSSSAATTTTATTSTTTSSTTTTTTSTTTSTTTTVPTTSAVTDPLPPGTHVVDVAIGDRSRRYLLFIPDSLTDPDLLLLGFHGFTSDPRNLAERAGLIDKAAAEGFVLALPAGLLGAWDAFAQSPDVDFARAVAADVSSRVAIDTARIYATGFSNGAALAVRLACDAADLVAAVGVVSPALLGAGDCEPERAVSVQAFHGTADEIVPYDGRGAFLPPIPAWAADWAARNGCDPSPTVVVVAADVELTRFSACDAGSVVELYSVLGGEHAWPRPDPPPHARPTTTGISATDVIWDFVSGFTLPR